MAQNVDQGYSPVAPQPAVASGGEKVKQLGGRRRSSESLLQKALRRLFRDRLTLVAMTVLGTLALMAVCAPLITQAMGISPTATSGLTRFQPVGTPGHWLGTDELGRDLFARLLYGGRVSLGIGFFGASFALTIGLVLGSMTGYFGGIMDDLMNWVVTTLDSIPSLYLLILISALLRPNATTLVLVVTLIGWTGTYRLMRGQSIQLRAQEFVVAARALGASHWRIIFAHLIPNLVSLVAIALASAIGGLILTESGLSFLGLGVQLPQPTWGNMLSRSQEYYAQNAATHVIVLPGLLIFITVLCLYIIGDGVRDAFDPRTND